MTKQTPHTMIRSSVVTKPGPEVDAHEDKGKKEESRRDRYMMVAQTL